MESPQHRENIIKKEINYLRDSLLIISFFKTGAVTERLKEKEISLKFIFFNIFILSLLRMVLEIIHWKSSALINYGYIQRWDFVNILGFTWQIAVFLAFVLPFSSVILSRLSSSLSNEKIPFIHLFNVYFYLALLFAISPLIDIIALYSGVPSYFMLPFTNDAIITMGQLVEAFIIPILTCIILYKFCKSAKIAIISTMAMGALFPFILYTPIIDKLMQIHIYQYTITGPSYSPMNIISWATENLVFSLIILIIVCLYLIWRSGFIKRIFKFYDFPIAMIFILSVVTGYLIGGQLIIFQFITTLIIAVISCWLAVSLLTSYFFNQTEKISNWMLVMGLFWLLTISFSLTLVVSFFAFFTLLAVSILNFAYIIIKSKNQQLRSSSIIKAYNFLGNFLFICASYLLILLGATPTIFNIAMNPAPLEAPSIDVLLSSILLGLAYGLVCLYFTTKKINNLRFSTSNNINDI